MCQALLQALNQGPELNRCCPWGGTPPSSSDQEVASRASGVRPYKLGCTSVPAHAHAHTLTASSHHLGPPVTRQPTGHHLEHLPVHLRVGLHSMLWEHEGDKGKALGLLGQTVDGVMQLRQGT